MNDTKKIIQHDNLKGLMASCIKRGTFTLASGQTSDFYFDGRLVTLNPMGMRLVGDVVSDFIEDVFHSIETPVPTAIGGPALGAIPVAVAACIRALDKHHRAYDCFVVRKEAKGHGTQQAIEGPPLGPESRVVLVEDVTTTGGSLLRAAKAVEATGAEILCAVTLLDREQGAKENFANAGISLLPMFTASQFQEES